MSYEIVEGKLVLSLNSDAGDEIVLAGLETARSNIVEDIEEEYSKIVRDGEVRKFRTANIKDNHEYLQAFNKVIEYFGGVAWDS